jgi:hypothetical protein
MGLSLSFYISGDGEVEMDTKFMLWFINVISRELKPPSAQNNYTELENLDVNASIQL